MWMTTYVIEIKKALRDQHGLVPSGGTEQEPLFDYVPDGEYPVVIEGRLDRVKLVEGKFNCCNFEDTPRHIQPMETAPKDGSFIILFGDSGYMTTPLRCEVCHYDADYRPLQPWVTYSNDSFLDSGGPPIGWMPLPKTND